MGDCDYQGNRWISRIEGFHKIGLTIRVILTIWVIVGFALHDFSKNNKKMRIRGLNVEKNQAIFSGILHVP